MSTTINGTTGINKIQDGTVDAGTLADDAVGLAQMASGTDGNLITYDASGDPAAVAVGTSGQVLTSNGAGAAPTMQTVSAGLAVASQWALTTSFTPAGTITANLAEFPTSNGYTRIGSAMTESSGVFTFPETGYYLIQMDLHIRLDSGSCRVYLLAETTLNNSTYGWSQCMASIVHTGVGVNSYNSNSASFIFKVSNTSTHKVRFYANDSGTAPTVRGANTGNDQYTNFKFIKLGDI